MRLFLCCWFFLNIFDTSLFEVKPSLPWTSTPLNYVLKTPFRGLGDCCIGLQIYAPIRPRGILALPFTKCPGRMFSFVPFWPESLVGRHLHLKSKQQCLVCCWAALRVLLLLRRCGCLHKYNLVPELDLCTVFIMSLMARKEKMRNTDSVRLSEHNQTVSHRKKNFESWF